MSRNRVIVISTVVLLVVCSAALTYAVYQNDSIHRIETEDQWMVSNSPLDQGDIFLDAYGDEERDSTYVYANHSDGINIQDYELVENNGTYSVHIEAKKGDNSGQIFQAEVKPSNLDRVRLNIGEASYSTGTCGCVSGDY